MTSILVTSETRVAGKDYSQTNKIFKTPSLKIYAIFHLGIIGSIYLRDQASTFISILPKIAFLLEIKVKASKPGVACKLFKRRTNHPNLFFFLKNPNKSIFPRFTCYNRTSTVKFNQTNQHT